MAGQNGSGSRERAFQDFYKATGFKPFSPEFTDSLIATMRSDSCALTEKVYAWGRWRGWGNSSLAPISDWAGGFDLDQLDCIVDLTWFGDGKPEEWVTGAPESVRKAARIAAQSLKGQYSRVFSELERQGRVAFDGQKMYFVVSPPGKPLTKVAEFSNFRNDPKFLEYWKVAEFSNFQARERAKQQLAEAQKLLRSLDRVAESAYEEYLKSATSEQPDIISCNPLSSNTAAANGDLNSAAAAAEVPHTTEADQVRQALCRVGKADLDSARRIIRGCREHFPQASAEDILLMVKTKAREMPRNVDSPIGWLVKVIPRSFEGYKPKTGPPPLTEREKNVAYLRGCWHEIEEEERARYLQQFPELKE